MTDDKPTYDSEGRPVYSIPFNDFFQCALSVDCVIFGFEGDELKVLLIKRGAEPFKGDWALPGDLMYPDEDLRQAATRVLQDLTGIENLFMEQSATFSNADRHPQGRVVTVSYYALVNIELYKPKAASWASHLAWHGLNDVPELAFDHKDILHRAMGSLRKTVSTRPVGFNLLPEKFTLKDVQKLYELILGRTFDKANFRKKLLSSKFLQPLNEMERDVAHRPAQLYRLSEEVDESSLLTV